VTGCSSMAGIGWSTLLTLETRRPGLVHSELPAQGQDSSSDRCLHDRAGDDQDLHHLSVRDLINADGGCPRILDTGFTRPALV
jgi:hypothetical protein